MEIKATSVLLLPYIWGFESVFAKEDSDVLLEHHRWDHIIELLSSLDPKSSKVYLLSPVKQKELNTFLEENLYTGCIYSLNLSIAALVFFIKKKNSSLWLVQDYWVLNSITVKNKYSLPLISKLVS